MPLTEISVRVTKKNINRTTSQIVASAMCPIAIALWERGYIAHVTRKVAIVYQQSTGELVNVFRLPETAQEFIRNFDEGNPVQPIAFVLERNLDEEE